MRAPENLHFREVLLRHCAGTLPPQPQRPPFPYMVPHQSPLYPLDAAAPPGGQDLWCGAVVRTPRVQTTYPAPPPAPYPDPELSIPSTHLTAIRARCTARGPPLPPTEALSAAFAWRPPAPSYLHGCVGRALAAHPARPTARPKLTDPATPPIRRTAPAYARLRGATSKSG